MTDVLEAKLVKRSGVGRDRKWTIAESDCGGRGVFATCDVASGDFVFADLPILTGPKFSSGLVACASCSNNSQPLRKCSRNCYLPFCSEECENEEAHKKECNFSGSLNLREEEWSPYIFRSLTLIRSLLMADEDKEVVERLHANRGKQVDIQVSSLLSILGNKLDDKDVKWLKHCCGVLDGTAFEIELENSTDSIKGLFPLSAMMNHKCVPNTRHFYTNRADGYRMLVVASQFIPKGAELFTSYCPLLWGTNLRRTFLFHTKHFACMCERCQDPSEFGTNLQAVKCYCGCIMLPLDPLNFNSKWKCDSCGGLRRAEHNVTIQKSLRNSNNLDKLLPECNYFIIQMKINNVFKKTSEKSLKDLTDNDLREVLHDCILILKRIVQLKLGNTRFKGRLCCRLQKIFEEFEQRGDINDEDELEAFMECGHAIEFQDQQARAQFP